MNLIQLSSARQAARPQPTPEADSVIDVPFIVKPAEQLDELFRRAYLEHEVRPLWLTYPSLRLAAEGAIRKLSLHWPVIKQGGGISSASSEAILAALVSVKNGLDQGENTKRWVIKNFLKTLSTGIANSVAGTQAWGYIGGRSAAQYDMNGWNFTEWAHKGKFDEIRFFIGARPENIEVEGTRLAFLCGVADARHVGMTELHQ